MLLKLYIMEEYVNLDTIVQDDFFNMFKESVICPLCLNILIEPIICMKCQKVYCKKCVDNWRKKNVECPNKCNPPDYQPCLVKKDILSILNFKCKGCGTQTNYYDAKKHHNICCSKIVPKEINIKGETGNEELVLIEMEKISNEEVELLRRKGMKIKNIKSKNNNIIIFIINVVLVLGNSKVGKTNLIQK